MIFNSKTNCFGIKETIFSTRIDMVLPTKTNCFGIMMIYDTFVKRVILDKKQIIKDLASNMMLLLKR